MKHKFAVIAFIFLAYTQAHAQTARQHFAELRVCFPDSDSPSFVIAKTGGGLFTQKYYKGVADSEPIYYHEVDGGYRIDFDEPVHHRDVYLIDWKTGRYRFQVYVLDNDKNVPVVEFSGKCELIGDTPSVAADRQTQQPQPQQDNLSNNNYYTNSDGNTVHSPAYSNSVPSGATAQCTDGTYSFSQHRQGTCSHHGGVSH
jgi:hypothetical protein